MKAEIYPVLASIERDLENPFSQPKGPWYGIEEDKRNALINSTISKFDHQLHSAPAADLAAYTEGLKLHLHKAMEWLPGGYWTEYQSIIARCHRNLTFAFYALILREYDIKGIAFNSLYYATDIGIIDYEAFSSEVCQAANDWGIIHTPAIAQLLAGTTGKRNLHPKEYILLADFPCAKSYLDRLVDSYLNNDFSLRETTSKADASIIAYVISLELKISAIWKYFEAFWNTDGLRDAFKQCKTRTNKDATREVLQTMLRKQLQGAPGDMEDTDKVEKYLRFFMTYP